VKNYTQDGNLWCKRTNTIISCRRKQHCNISRANIGMSQNVCFKVQTQNANLKLAKSKFKAAFIRMCRNEFLRILKRWATNSQSMNIVFELETCRAAAHLSIMRARSVIQAGSRRPLVAVSAGTCWCVGLLSLMTFQSHAWQMSGSGRRSTMFCRLRLHSSRRLFT